jgi:galactokinase/mevalonate kinase-like predicted kinase
VLADTRVSPDGARALAEAADACWTAIRSLDAPAFGRAFTASFDAQVAMFPNMANPGIYDLIHAYRDHAYGWKLSGAGGGGYLILVADRFVPDSIQVKIRRQYALF